jgi:SH3 domain-containing YSC84-like protein 1
LRAGAGGDSLIETEESRMTRRDTIALLLLLTASAALPGCVQTAPKDIEAQSLVDRSKATLALFKARTEKANQLFRAQLEEAQGVLIFPQVVKGAFLFGAEGGDGVLVARNPDGTWGYPAFYTLGGGSFGLQIGGQASEMILVLRSRGAVQAVVNNQGKFGGDLQLTVGTVGAGLEASTTTNFGADIVGFSRAAGIYGGASLEGAGIIRNVAMNQAYYGRGATSAGIVLENRYSNPGAAALREELATPAARPAAWHEVGSLNPPGENEAAARP